MRGTTRVRNTVFATGLALGAVAGAAASLGSYVRREIKRRGYPTWEDCQCDFKTKQTVFQVWHSHHEQRGETVVAQEWGSYVSNPAPWLRRLLHYSAQVLATLNPRGRYVERVTLSPQKAPRFVALLHSSPSNEELPGEATPEEESHIVWRREILHVPRHTFDPYLYRLYPAPIPAERVDDLHALPTLWDPHSNLPLPTEGALLATPLGTRIDYVGWAASQISYCTARLSTAKTSRKKKN